MMFGAASVVDELVRGLGLTAIGLGWVILVVRLSGLRSFSKMTAFDFVVTLATGSLFATAASAASWNVFVQALAAIACLLGLQVALGDRPPDLAIRRGHHRKQTAPADARR